MDADHWYRNLRQTVRFEPAVRTLIGAGVDALIEIGPHPVLTTPLAEIVDESVEVISTLRRADGGLERFIRSLAEAHVAGVDVDWTALFGAAAAARVPLPTYAFQHRRYWLAPGSHTSEPAALGQAAAEHPLLDAAVALAGDQGTVFTGRLSLERHPWLADHVVLGQVVLPAAVFVDLALYAGAQTDAPAVDELALSTPLVLDADHAVVLQVSVSAPDPAGRRQLTIHSRRDTDWTPHATATLAPEHDAPEPLAPPPRPDGATAIEFDDVLRPPRARRPRVRGDVPARQARVGARRRGPRRARAARRRGGVVPSGRARCRAAARVAAVLGAPVWRARARRVV